MGSYLLPFWNDFLCAFFSKSCNRETNRTRIVFAVNTPPNETLSGIFTILQEECSFSIYLDMDDSLKKMLPLPEESQYQCFLLDKKRRVKLIGKPIFNSSLFDKYLSFIFES